MLNIFLDEALFLLKYTWKGDNSNDGGSAGKATSKPKTTSHCGGSPFETKRAKTPETQEDKAKRFHVSFIHSYMNSFIHSFICS